MDRSGEQQVRLEIASILEAIAAEPGWNNALYAKIGDLLKRTDVDGLLAHADEELIHYSGESNSRNLRMFPVKPDEIQVRGYKSEFRQLADAIRSGKTWDEYKRANRIYEAGDLSEALKRLLKRLLKR